MDNKSDQEKPIIQVPGLSNFRLCTLDDDTLLHRVTTAMFEMYITGEIPSRHIPARPDQDFDLLLGELVLRFQNYKSRAAWADKNIQEALKTTETHPDSKVVDENDHKSQFFGVSYLDFSDKDNPGSYKMIP